MNYITSPFKGLFHTLRLFRGANQLAAKVSNLGTVDVSFFN
jgi:hypothetical protein